MERGRLYPAVAANDCHGSFHPGSRGCHLEEAGIGVAIQRLWRKPDSKQQDAWPRMEQGEYRSYRAVHPFDERFGVDTSGLVYELPSGHQHDPYNNGYFAVAPSVFHSVMQALRDRLALDTDDSASWMWGRGRAVRCCWLRTIHFARSLGSSCLLSWIASPEPTLQGMPAHAIERQSARSRGMRPRSNGRP